MSCFTSYSARAAFNHLLGIQALPAPAALEIGLLDASLIEVADCSGVGTSYIRVPSTGADWQCDSPIEENADTGATNIVEFQFPVLLANDKWTVKYVGIYEAGTDNLLFVAALEKEITYGTGGCPMVPKFAIQLGLDLVFEHK